MNNNENKTENKDFNLYKAACLLIGITVVGVIVTVVILSNMLNGNQEGSEPEPETVAVEETEHIELVTETIAVPEETESYAETEEPDTGVDELAGLDMTTLWLDYNGTQLPVGYSDSYDFSAVYTDTVWHNAPSKDSATGLYTGVSYADADYVSNNPNATRITDAFYSNAANDCLAWVYANTGYSVSQIRYGIPSIGYDGAMHMYYGIILPDKSIYTINEVYDTASVTKSPFTYEEFLTYEKMGYDNYGKVPGQPD